MHLISFWIVSNIQIVILKLLDSHTFLYSFAALQASEKELNILDWTLLFNINILYILVIL